MWLLEAIFVAHLGEGIQLTRDPGALVLPCSLRYCRVEQNHFVTLVLCGTVHAVDRICCKLLGRY